MNNPSKAQLRARKLFSKAQKKALDSGLKPFTKEFGDFIKNELQKNKSKN